MNKLALALSAALTLGAVSAANAQSGQINFTGEIAATTCSIDFSGIGGSGSSPTITLPKLAAASLGAAGAVAGNTPITLTVGNQTGCDVGTATLELNPNRAASVTNGRLNNLTAVDDAAKNLQVQMRDADDKVIDLTSPWLSAPIDLTTGKVLKFSAEYYATDAVTAGELSSNVQYTMNYR